MLRNCIFYLNNVRLVTTHENMNSYMRLLRLHVCDILIVYCNATATGADY